MIVPTAEVGVTRLDGLPKKRRGEEVEEAQEEGIYGPPFDVLVQLVEYNMHVICGDEEK